MRILLLCEGDARTFDSWSGISRSIVNEMERRGHELLVGDCDLYGPSRFAAAALTFSPSRKRWWVRYHLGAAPFFLRSRRARVHQRRIREAPEAILQFGATFAPPSDDIPMYLYCDGNIRLSQSGAAGGESDAAFLTSGEIDAIAERERAVYERAEHIFCISDRLAQSFIDDFGIPASRLSTVYAGGHFDPTSVEPDFERRRAAPPTVLFVGRAFARKGGDTLLEAFPKVVEAVPHARLVVVGPDAIPAAGDGIHFLGKLNRDDPREALVLEQAFQDATVFAMPTRFEGLSISFLEAMLFGLPCVSASSTWARPEMIVENETGLSVPIDDAAELAACLIRLLRNRSEAERMGRAGRERALELFTWEQVVDRMLERMTGLGAPGDFRDD
jgi:glycosyltransferase involved in cell wall biosynthesis